MLGDYDTLKNEPLKTYEERGWKLLPLKTGSKRPAVRSVLPYRERGLTDVDKATYFKFQDSNVAIITGKASNLVVIDIDVPDLGEKYLEQYPTGLVAKTPRGGYHLYFSYDGDDIGNFEGLEPGVDVRGEGGYIVAYPSRVTYTDDKYRGTTLYGHTGEYEWLEWGEPAPLPPEMELRLKRGGIAEVASTLPEDGHDLWARILREGFTPGRHNKEVHDAARYLFRMGTDVTAIYRMLGELNDKDPSPQPEGELKAGIKSAIDYERSRMKQEEPQQAIDPPKTFDVLGVSSFLAKYGDYDVEWLIDQWIPDKSLIIISAAPGHYKTWLLLDLAVSVALGKQSLPFLDTEIESERQPVLIVQQEDYTGLVAQRIRTILRAKGQAAKYRLVEIEGEKGGTVYSFGSVYHSPIYIHVDAMLAFDNPDSVAGLERVIKEKGIKLVVIDPLYTLDPADNYFLETGRHLMYFKRLREKYGVTFVITHHNRKSGGKGREQIFGSTLVNAAFEGAWVIFDGDNDLLIVERGGKFFKETTQKALTFDIDTSPGNESYYVTAQDIADALADTSQFSGKHDKAVYEYLCDVDGAIQSRVAEACGVSSKVAKDSLDRLKDNGFIIKSGRTWKVRQEMGF